MDIARRTLSTAAHPSAVRLGPVARSRARLILVQMTRLFVPVAPLHSPDSCSFCTFDANGPRPQAIQYDAHLPTTSLACRRHSSFCSISFFIVSLPPAVSLFLFAHLLTRSCSAALFDRVFLTRVSSCRSPRSALREQLLPSEVPSPFVCHISASWRAVSR